MKPRGRAVPGRVGPLAAAVPEEQLGRAGSCPCGGCEGYAVPARSCAGAECPGRCPELGVFPLLCSRSRCPQRPLGCGWVGVHGPSPPKGDRSALGGSCRWC